MPRLPIDYSKGLIYKIVCNDIKIKEVYYGSTTSFVKRKNSHKSNCINPKNRDYNQPKYQFIRENGGWSNWDMIEIKKYDCETKRELELEERKQIEIYGVSLNHVIPTRSKEEYDIDNKEKQAEYKKIWYQNNKEETLEQKKLYYHNNKEKQNEKFECECGGRYTFQHKSIHNKTKKHLKFIN